MFGKKNKNEDIYFSELSDQAYLPSEGDTIKAALDESGEWVESDEWRISTWTDYKISKSLKFLKQTLDLLESRSGQFF